MFFSTISAPVFVEISKGHFKDFFSLIRKNNIYAEKILIISDSYCSHKFLSDLSLDFQVVNIEDCRWIDLKDHVVEYSIDLIVGIGGGRVVDVAKLVAYEAKKLLVVIPTLLSSDSIASPVSVIWDGDKYKKFRSSVPSGIIVDLDLIYGSPKIYTLAGIGDLLAKFSSTYDFTLGSQRLNLKFNFLAKNMCSLSSRLFLASHGTEAFITYDLLSDLANGLILCGLSMDWAGTTYPASGSEHNIAHTIDMLYPDRSRIHGLTVGFFTLFTLYLQKQKRTYFDILAFYRRIGFPLSLDEVKVGVGDMKEVLKRAPHIRKRFTILNTYSFPEMLGYFEKWIENYEECW